METIAIRLEAVASRLEAIALRLEANASRLEAIALRVEAVASRLEAIALRLEAIRLEANTSRLEAIALRVEAVASRLEAIALRLEAIALRLEAIALRLEAIALRLEAIALRLEANASRKPLLLRFSEPPTVPTDTPTVKALQDLSSITQEIGTEICEKIAALEKVPSGLRVRWFKQRHVVVLLLTLGKDMPRTCYLLQYFYECWSLAKVEKTRSKTVPKF